MDLWGLFTHPTTIGRGDLGCLEHAGYPVRFWLSFLRRSGRTRHFGNGTGNPSFAGKPAMLTDQPRGCKHPRGQSASFTKTNSGMCLMISMIQRQNPGV
jgi:hypothetical protein